MKTLIEEISNSNDALLQEKSKAIQKWKSLLHNKEGLETFLSFNICVLKFKKIGDKKFKTVTCTSNMRFIEAFKATKKSDQDIANKSTPYDGIHTHDQFSTMTYDIISQKLITVNLNSWEILDILPLDPSYLLMLVNYSNRYLGKEISNL